MSEELKYHKTSSQVNYGWNLTWEATGRFPIIAKRAFTTLENAQSFVDSDATACEGLILAVFNDTEKNNGIYFVQSIGDGTANSGVLVKAGSGTGSITATNYSEAKTLATADNIGQLIYVINDETSTTELTPDSTEENPVYVVYTAGPYVVTGEGTISKLGTTSASGDISGDVETLKGNVATLQKDVEDLKNAELPVTDIQFNGVSLLENSIAELNKLIDTTFTDNSESDKAISHKAVAAKFEAIESLISELPKFSIEVVESLPESEISESVIYLLKTGEESQNLYEEYIYLGSEKGWEKLGTQKLDLSGYYNKEEIDSLLGGYVKVEDGKSLISEEDLTQITTNKDNITQIKETLDGKDDGEVHTPGLVEKITNIEGEIDTLQGETLVSVESTETTYLTSTVDEGNNRLTKLTPVIGSFKTETVEEKEGLATINNVKDFVQREIDSAFAWVEVEETEE